MKVQDHQCSFWIQTRESRLVRNSRPMGILSYTPFARTAQKTYGCSPLLVCMAAKSQIFNPTVFSSFSSHPTVRLSACSAPMSNPPWCSFMIPALLRGNLKGGSLVKYSCPESSPKSASSRCTFRCRHPHALGRGAFLGVGIFSDIRFVGRSLRGI